MMIFPNTKVEFSVLIIEDELSTIRGTMRGISHKVTSISSVGTIAEAETLIINNKYDLLILDVQLPNVRGGKLISESGIDLIGRLQKGDCGKMNRDIPFMILTAQNRSLRLDKTENNANCIGICGKLSHMEVISKINELLTDRVGASNE